VAGAWRKHWRALWPARHPGRAPLDAMLGMLAAQRQRLEDLPDNATSTESFATLERRLQSMFRRFPLGPAASVAYLGLLALDLRRMRGALATRALREGANASTQ